MATDPSEIRQKRRKLLKDLIQTLQKSSQCRRPVVGSSDSIQQMDEPDCSEEAADVDVKSENLDNSAVVLESATIAYDLAEMELLESVQKWIDCLTGG